VNIFELRSDDSADEKVAPEMNTYWANFVKTGNPNGAGLLDWLSYHSTSDMLRFVQVA
jgi:para-nitrobenzyl esterase